MPIELNGLVIISVMDHELATVGSEEPVQFDCHPGGWTGVIRKEGTGVIVPPPPMAS